MIEVLDLPDLMRTAAVLGVAFVLGTLIGAERQFRQRNAGLRTHVLVVLGAASFVHLGVELNGNLGAVQVVAYVVSGVGFLGAGVIMREGGEVRGLNTAATLWGSAAVGGACGAHHVGQAVLVTVLVLAGNTLLRPLANTINREPLDETTTKTSYEIRVVVANHDVLPARDLVVETLETARHVLRGMTVRAQGADHSEIVAALVPHTIDTAGIEAAVRRLEASVLVERASWTATTPD